MRRTLSGPLAPLTWLLQGVFVVQDFNFRWLSSFSSSSDQHTKDMALLFLLFPCGMIRGALANLGVTAIVNADITTLPGCTFVLSWLALARMAYFRLTIVHCCCVGLFNIKIKG